MFRNAERRDADDLARIYNHAMKPGANVTPRVSEVSRADRVAWLESLKPPFGAWVYEVSPGGVVGWCALVPFAVRPRIPRIAELSVYVDEKHRSGFVGGRLLAFVVDEARRLGFRSLVSIASDKNVQSLSGCLAYGFRQTATLRQVGRLSGQLANATWLQKDLLEDDPPQYRKIRDSILRAAGRTPGTAIAGAPSSSSEAS
jgi:L-amino acid N-acyltransferase YncA